MYLNCHTYYSYKYGILSIDELLEQACAQGHSHIAITDINSTSGWVDIVRHAKKHNIHVSLGLDFRNGRFNQNSTLRKPSLGTQELQEENTHSYGQSLYVGIALNAEGRHELNRFLSEHLMEKKPFPERAPAFEHVVVVYSYKRFKSIQIDSSSPSLEEASGRIEGWQLNPKNEYIGLAPEDLNTFRFKSWGKELLKQDKLVILHPATFRHKRDFNTHRLLRAIDNNLLLSMLPKSEQGLESDSMMSLIDLYKHFEAFPSIIANTKAILQATANEDVHAFAYSKTGTHLNLQCYSGSEAEDEALLRRLCQEGLAYRYPKPSEAVYARIDKELDIIIRQGFVSYFLINWDIINYARSQDYYYVGRGSGANSVVAYLLRITDVDPIELDLYFERFINLFRATPPDFDIDFSWADREDITRYIFKRFPTATLLGAYSTFQFRGARRELGKVFGLPSEEIEQIGGQSRYAHFQPKWEKKSHDPNQTASSDHLKQLVIKYASLLIDRPSHLSIHACGILIPDKPITYYTSTFMPPKGFPTAQMSMLEAEDIGINKFDILSQRGLGKIKDCLALIRENHPDAPAIDIHDIKRFKADERIKAMLRVGDAIGCFYVESPAMRMLMRKLEVDDYLGLVAASSVIRPGVAQSGMMREYILRKRNPERRQDAHPVMLEIMPETFGVMVYQEDVIKVAHYFAGLTLGEADVLRRGMSGKYRSREEFQAVKDKFFSNCIHKKGYTHELTAEIWRQTESFAGYAFAKGHSASYAVESYQSLFLKAYYPLEYMVATVNNGGGFYTREHYIHEARMQGGQIEAPCVQHSRVLTRIVGKTIMLGLHMVKGLDNRIAEDIVQARKAEGRFQNLQDLLDRVSMGMEQLSILIHVGALRNLDSRVKNQEASSPQTKKELLWEAYAIMEKKRSKAQEQARLFRPDANSYTLPHLDHQQIEDAFDEMEYLGFPLCHPFDLLREPVDDPVRFNNLHEHIGEQVTVYGYLVTAKNTKTIKGDNMNFGNFVDRDGDFLDTVHFPQVAARYPFRGKGVYKVIGKVVNEFDFQTIEVAYMERLAYVDDPRYVELNEPSGDNDLNRIRTENLTRRNTEPKTKVA